MILTLRTDKPESEIGLFDHNGKQLSYCTWQAHRQLSETIHNKLNEQLQIVHGKLTDISGIVIYQGSGSFTGLRIGVSVANALAYSLGVPVVATKGKDWLKQGQQKLTSTDTGDYVKPYYGNIARITKPKK